MSPQAASAAAKPLKVFIFSMDGVGHINACVGLAQALAVRGHKIHFLLNEANKNQFTKFGFQEILLRKGEPPGPKQQQDDQPPANPVKQMAQFLLASGFLSDKSPFEKLKSQANGLTSLMQMTFAQLAEYNPQIEAAVKREQPDLLIVDHFLVPPVAPMSGIPWMQLFSGNPLSLNQSDKLPPSGGGFAVDADPESWKEFKQLQEDLFMSVFGEFQKKLNDKFDYSPPVEEENSKASRYSKYLNIYGYPEELDYHDVVPVLDQFARVDAFMRETAEPFELPEEFVNKSGGGKLIYVSLGSMGSVDVELMKRITTILAKSPHKFIVSKGPRADEYELPPNCWGEGFLPQTNILPIVDLVITHGGNNTITETFSSGKPMIVLPLFADQYDNAQRVTEKGYGARLAPYSCAEADLLATIERLLNDKQLNQKCQAAAKRIASSNSKELVCKRIEQVVENAKQ